MTELGRLAARSPVDVLVVEDETALLDLVARTLEISGFRVLTASTLAEALVQARECPPGLAVVDLMLPDGSGMELIHRLREVVPGLPVVILTARDSLEDRLTGFTMGADDYVTKPFAVAELVARVNAVLRRSSAASELSASGILEVADLRLDDAAHVVTRGGEAVDLSPTEYRLLRCLMLHSGRVLSRSQLLDSVWDYADAAGVAVVEKFISQLRRKIDSAGRPPLLHTVRGFGYVLREGPPR
jgi:two-component system OmpR family response regulator